MLKRAVEWVWKPGFWQGLILFLLFFSSMQAGFWLISRHEWFTFIGGLACFWVAVWVMWRAVLRHILRAIGAYVEN